MATINYDKLNKREIAWCNMLSKLLNKSKANVINDYITEKVRRSEKSTSLEPINNP